MLEYTALHHIFHISIRVCGKQSSDSLPFFKSSSKESASMLSLNEQHLNMLFCRTSIKSKRDHSFAFRPGWWTPFLPSSIHSVIYCGFLSLLLLVPFFFYSILSSSHFLSSSFVFSLEFSQITSFVSTSFSLFFSLLSNHFSFVFSFSIINFFLFSSFSFPFSTSPLRTQPILDSVLFHYSSSNFFKIR